MDKKVDLTKVQKERKYPFSSELCCMTSSDYIKYLKIYFINTSPTTIPVISTLISALKKKQCSYRQQDRDKNKYNDSTFITIDDIVGKLIVSNMKCYYCLRETCIFYGKVRQSNQWTLERLDNETGHSNKNTVISCLDCNLKRRNSNSNAFCFSKQLVIKKV